MTMTYEDLFYKAGEPSGLPHDPFKSLVVPRPIGWISTQSKDGVDNIAPYSQFTNVSFDPPTVLFVAHQSHYKKRFKDTVRNCHETEEFVWNMATYDLREQVNETALETHDDEFEIAGLTKTESKLVKPPRVKESPVQFECKVHSILRIPGREGSLVGTSDIVIGRVVGIHIKGEAVNADGLIDVLKLKPIARLGYWQYSAIESVFEMKIPLMPDDVVGMAVLAGNQSKLQEHDPAQIEVKKDEGKEGN
jgi:flavin reductase (DIM6/NTAB) family NADH-FMN oxidoreductase RutF